MWKIADGPLKTRWGSEFTPQNVHSEYPRPQFVREAWQNLNGLWDYAITPQFSKAPAEFAGKILVPFPIESALSGVMKPVGVENQLWYRRTFAIPNDWKNRSIRLNFGAVDWECTVWVNGHLVGEHRGGYNAFSFDITHALKKTGEQEIMVAVWDPADAGTQARGKQVAEPHAIWYTSVTGIWQTVWLEPVNEVYLESLEMTPDIDKSVLKVRGFTNVSDLGMKIEAHVRADGQLVATDSWVASQASALAIPDARLWSPHQCWLFAPARSGRI